MTKRSRLESLFQDAGIPDSASAAESMSRPRRLFESLRQKVWGTEAEESTTTHTERLDEWLVGMGLTHQDIDAYEERLHSRASSRQATSAAVGVGVGTWVLIQINTLMTENPSVLKSVKFGGTQLVKVVVKNWDELEIAYSVADVVGFGDPLQGFMTLAEMGWSAAKLAAEHGELALDIAEVAVDGADIAEGVATLGLSIAASYGAKRLFEHLNKEQEEKLQELNSIAEELAKLKAMVEETVPTRMLSQQLLALPPASRRIA